MPYTRIFSTEFLEEELDFPWGDSVVFTEFQDSGRWAENWKGVFELEGEFWEVSFELPATEMQEGQGMWCEQSQVKATRVEEREVTVKKWLPVD